MVRMARLPIISTLSLSVFLAAAVWIARVDRAGPPHGGVALPGGGRATVYLPGTDASRAFLDPPPPEERPPAVVVMHGFAGDRNSMSGISRRIAASGYAVLNLDLDGHGENRTPYARVRATSDGFYAVVADAVDFLRTWPFVDGSRIAVMGHSMGAAAALDYATRDSGIDAAVLVSGGRHVQGPFPPGNVLFLYAAGDPDRVRAILGDAGYTSIDVDPLRTEVSLGGGGTLDEIVDFALEMGPASAALKASGQDVTQEIRDAVRDALSPHTTGKGVSMDAAAWVVAARAR